MSIKRHSVLPASGPKAPANLAPTIVIAETAVLTGAFPITVSDHSVIHPRVRLDSAHGPVNIGRRCIVLERAHVGAPVTGAGAGGGEGSVTIGDNVTLEVGAVVETGGTVVGEGSVLGVGCRVGGGASVGKVSLLGVSLWWWW